MRFLLPTLNTDRQRILSRRCEETRQTYKRYDINYVLHIGIKFFSEAEGTNILKNSLLYNNLKTCHCLLLKIWSETHGTLGENYKQSKWNKHKRKSNETKLFQRFTPETLQRSQNEINQTLKAKKKCDCQDTLIRDLPV